MIFDLPSNLSADLLDDLEGACIAGGMDGMPFTTEACVNHGHLILKRLQEESGCLLAPWPVPGFGQLMIPSGTLMERATPYCLPLELARGKLNQLRGQTADWMMGGLQIPASVHQLIREATRAFVHAIAQMPEPSGLAQADRAIAAAFGAAQGLVEAYQSQVFQVRHQRQHRFETLIGSALVELPGQTDGAAFQGAFNSVTVSLPWSEIEPLQGHWDWARADALVEWGERNGLALIGGPLVDFSGRNLPDWIWEHERDLFGLGGAMCQFAEQVVRRYQKRIHLWQISAGSNISGVLAQGDEELLWLTMRLAETVRRVASNLEIFVGLAQPWGDYLIQQPRTESPFRFADKLQRTGLRFSALALEIIMGVSPRGSYCRDTLDLSRILDLYALLGAPLQVNLGYPSANGRNDQADPDQKAGNGYWREGFTPAAQADWAASFAALALSKPYVRAIQWTHWSDAHAHVFPHCGLLDEAGQVKPAVEALRRMRTDHIK